MKTSNYIKTIFTLLLLIFFLSASFSQKTFNYQGVVLDDSGKPISNENVTISISISNTSFFQTASTKTSELGAFSVNLSIEDLDFSKNTEYEINTSVTTSKGTVSSTSPLSYVPLAMYAEKAKGIIGVESLDSSSTNELQSLSIDGTKLTISGGNTVNLPTSGGDGDGDNDPNNEVQKLTLDKDNTLVILGLTLTGEKISFDVSDRDSDDKNEVQYLSIDGEDLILSGATGNPSIVSLSSLGDGTEDDDADPENELQELSLDGNELFISDGNSVILPLGGDGDADADPENEIQDLSNTKNGSEVTVGISLGGESTTINVDDADSDPENELQTLTDISDPGSDFSIQISDGNSINMFSSLPDQSSSNEIQTLYMDSDSMLALTNPNGSDFTLPNDWDQSNELQLLDIDGNILGISNGNTVDLSGVGGSSIWFMNNDESIQYSSGNVGIYSSNPSEALEVNGNIKTSGNLIPSSTGQDIGGTSDYWRYIYTDRINLEGGGALRTNGNEVLLTGYGNDITMQMGYPNSKIGIGVSSPAYKLDVAGSIFSTNNVYAEGEFKVKSGSTSIVRIGENSGGEGFVYTYDGSGSALVKLTSSGGNGYISVTDGSSNQAGIYVNSSGQGVVWGDVKNFVTDYPGRSNQSIVYASLEGPEAAAYERGTATLVNGEATINFSDHYRHIGSPRSMTVIITPLSADSKGIAVVSKGKIGFSVKELFKGNGNYSFDWEVKCKRIGYEDYKVIRDKSEFKPSVIKADDKK